MENKYRQHIVKNTEKLIRLTDYDKFMHACVYSGLLSQVMRQLIEDVPPRQADELSAEELQHERHRRLFLKLTKRGPDAYQQIKSILSDLKFEGAVMLLNEPRHDDDSEFQSLHQRAGTGEGDEKLRNNGTDEPQRKEQVSKKLTPEVLSNGNSGIEGLQESDGCYSSKKPQNELDSLELQEYTAKVQPTIVHRVEKAKQVHVNAKVGIYPMHTQHNRGVFFMVNIIDFPISEDKRNGAEEDGASLLHLFKELGFKLFAYENLTQEQFFYWLEKIIDSEHTRNAECFVMALMTHGTSEERVQFADGSVVKVRDIETHFENQKCPHLVHKPKIFIFPFCRGNIADKGFYRRASDVQTDSVAENRMRAFTANLPSLSDIFICYASMRGYKAHRDVLDGSWYIQKFYELMAQHAHDTDFEDIVKMIQQETGKLRTEEGAMQTGSYTNIGFNKKLFFNPGAWEE